MKPSQPINTRQDPFFSDGLIQQPNYGSGFQSQQSYPGVNGYNGFGSASASTQIAAPAASTGLPFNLNQIKGIVDRMGGIEGVMGHVSRIQKFIQSMQQMAPMIKVLMNSFGSKASTASKLDGDGLASSGRQRRRAARRKSSKRTYKRRTGR